MNRMPVVTLALLLPTAASAQAPAVSYRRLADVRFGVETKTGHFVSSPDGRFVMLGGNAVLDLKSGRRTSLGPGQAGVWSPRGDLIVFARQAKGGTGSRIWTVAMDPRTGTPTGLPRRLSANPGQRPFFSADGHSVIYFTQAGDTSSIVEIPVSGGPERVLYRETGFQFRLGAETPDGRWIYFQDSPTQHYWGLRISRIPAGGGPRRTIVPHLLHYVGLSRDGRYLAYYPEADPFFAFHPLVAVTDLDGREIARIQFPRGLRATWGRGHTMVYLVYRVPKGIHAFDLRTGATRALTSDSSGDTHPAYSPDGSKLAVVRPVGERYRLVLLAPSGDSARIVPTTTEPENTPLHWSPDGSAVAFVTTEDPPRIDVVDVTTGRETLLRVDFAGNRWSPIVWRRDGRALRYVRDDGSRNLSVREVTLDGRDREVRRIALRNPTTYEGPAVAFAGDSAVVVQSPGLVRLFPLAGGGRTIATFVGDVHGDVAVSPDGQWVAYTTSPDSAVRSERYMVTIAPLAGGEARTLPFGAADWSGLAWDPDAKHVAVNAFVSWDDATPQLGLLPITGEAPRRLAAHDRSTDFDDWSFSPDGATLAVACEQGLTATLMSADLSGVLASAATGGGR